MFQWLKNLKEEWQKKPLTLLIPPLAGGCALCVHIIDATHTGNFGLSEDTTKALITAVLRLFILLLDILLFMWGIRKEQVSLTKNEKGQHTFTIISKSRRKIRLVVALVCISFTLFIWIPQKSNHHMVPSGYITEAADFVSSGIRKRLPYIMLLTTEYSHDSIKAKINAAKDSMIDYAAVGIAYKDNDVTKNEIIALIDSQCKKDTGIDQDVIRMINLTDSIYSLSKISDTALSSHIDMVMKLFFMDTATKIRIYRTTNYEHEDALKYSTDCKESLNAFILSLNSSFNEQYSLHDCRVINVRIDTMSFDLIKTECIDVYLK